MNTHARIRLATLLALGCAFWILGCEAPTDPFTSAFPAATERVWIGPDYYANRLMDWRLHDGRLECLEGRAAKPMRTLHLLTLALREEPGALAMSVRTGPIAPGDSAHENTWTGFLIGVGGDHVDFRISALAHHWPADDGGLIVALDGTGTLIVRHNTNPDAPKGARADIELSAWPLVEPASIEVFSEASTDVVLKLEAEPDGDAYRLRVSAHDGESGNPISTATYEDIAAEHLSGNVALVSHNSPLMDGPGYWFRQWQVGGTKVARRHERAFGPVMGTQYTLSRGVLKMTAQMGPLGPEDTRHAELQIERGNAWETVATGTLIDDSFTVPFRVEDWDESAETPYRIAYDLRTGDGTTETHYFPGTIRRPPTDRNEFVLASLNCQNMSAINNLHWNHSRIWYPHGELVDAVRHHDPDLLFFAGDQIYEGGLAGIIRAPTDKAILDYLYHWYRFVWAFRDLMRDRPTVTIPDDHDVYHGNIWGDGGIKAEGPYQPQSDNGGYIMDPLFVNAVHRTQVAHLPDPIDPTPIEQDITVYYTDLRYAGISFAIVADRMWKSTPIKVLPQAEIWNGWPKNSDYDPTTVTEATLLGDRQLAFLDRWAHDWTGGTWMKVMLSQTLFSNLATLPAGANDDSVVPGMRYAEPGEYIPDDHLGVDMDSNGWPQAGRNRALRTIRKGFAFHVGGDQHLGSFVQYGIDAFNDGPYAFISPAIANIWPRRWFPPEPGGNRVPGSPPYTGEHRDGFGNRMTVHAVANPVRSGQEPEALYDRVPGYGIIRFKRSDRTITAEAWPRWVDPASRDAAQYFGWPVTVHQQDNYGRAAAGFLPTLTIQGMKDPVIQVIDETTQERVYTLRIQGQAFRPKVFDAAGSYTVVVGEPGTERMQTLTGLKVTDDEGAVREVVF